MPLCQSCVTTCSDATTPRLPASPGAREATRGAAGVAVGVGSTVAAGPRGVNLPASVGSLRGPGLGPGAASVESGPRETDADRGWTASRDAVDADPLLPRAIEHILTHAAAGLVAPNNAQV